MKYSQIDLILKMTGLPVETLKTCLASSVGLTKDRLDDLSLAEFREILADFMQNILLEAKQREQIEPIESGELAKLIPFKRTPTC